MSSKRKSIEVKPSKKHEPTMDEVVKAIQGLRKDISAITYRVIEAEDLKFTYEKERNVRRLLRDLLEEIVGFKIPEIKG